MIKLIIEEHYSKPDIYGNRYWFTVLKSTEGETFTYSDNTNNAKHYARDAGLEWDEIHAVEIAHPIREFNRLQKGEYFSREEIISKIKGMVEYVDLFQG